MKALCLTENEADMEELKELFIGNFPDIEFFEAKTRKEALDTLSDQGAFAILMLDSDLSLSNPNKVALDLIDILGERPLIFLGEKDSIAKKLTSSTLSTNENNTILEKPYTKFNVIESVQTILNWAEQQDFSSGISEFKKADLLPMKLRNFFLFDQIPYDAYIELTSTKFNKVISKNQPYTEAEILTLSRRNIRQLYLKKDDYLNFLEETVATLNEKLQSGLLKGQKEILLQIQAALVIHQYIRAVGISDSIIDLTSTLINSTHTAFRRTSNLRSVLKFFPIQHRDFAEQSLLTNYFSYAIIDKMGWTSDLSKNKLGLASLLQDAMLSNEKMMKLKGINDPELLFFTPEEQEEFKNHPKEAAKLCRYFQGFPEADFIIAQHHELPNGTGFPAQLNAGKITTLSCAFILASTMASNLIVEGIDEMNIRNILSQLKATHDIGNFKPVFQALEKAMR